ncbi:MAG: hypothetical protein M3P93_01480, partial [Actinomycetota bacterium]|nr:hypothetical protein [Actinomycetota bacterium]
MSSARPDRPRPGLRAAVEQRSAVPLAWLSLRPRWVPLVVVLALLLGAGLLPPAAGLACLVLVLGLVGWLTYLSWPVLGPGARAARLAVVAMVVALL